MTTRADIVAALAGDLASPRVVEAIDDVIRDLLGLRKLAARLHKVTTPPPFGASDNGAEAAHGQPPNDERQSDGWTIASLVHRYRTDERSPYRQLRYRTRQSYDSLIKRIVEDCGNEKLADLKARNIQALYDGWMKGGKMAMAHSLATMLRALINFGTIVLEDPACERLLVLLHNMRFSNARGRSSEPLTEDQVKRIINKAHEMGYHSLALAQAIQFECALRQKDVIGEWVPQSEPGMSDVIDGEMKWLQGIRWSEINSDLVLTHVTSKGGKTVEVRLAECRLVKAEFARLGDLPQSGPIIKYEKTKRPYLSHQFRRVWRIVANAAEIRKGVKNMDSTSADDELPGAQREKGSAP